MNADLEWWRHDLPASSPPADNWWRSARLSISKLVEMRMPFTSDAVRLACLHLGPPPSGPKVWGALLRTLSIQGRVRRIGVERSKMPSTHGRMLTLWRGV